MRKSRLAKKFLFSAMIVEGVYIVLLTVLTLLQKQLKLAQNAPLGTRDLFYFPIDDVAVAVVSLLVMTALTYAMLPRLKANARLGKYPAIGMILFGAVTPVISMLTTKWEVSRYSSEKTSTVEHMISAEYLNGAIAWVAPLLFVAAALFVIGSAIALCTKDE